MQQHFGMLLALTTFLTYLDGRAFYSDRLNRACGFLVITMHMLFVDLYVVVASMLLLHVLQQDPQCHGSGTAIAAIVSRGNGFGEQIRVFCILLRYSTTLADLCLQSWRRKCSPHPHNWGSTSCDFDQCVFPHFFEHFTFARFLLCYNGKLWQVFEACDHASRIWGRSKMQPDAHN